MYKAETPIYSTTLTITTISDSLSFQIWKYLNNWFCLCFHLNTRSIQLAAMFSYKYTDNQMGDFEILKIKQFCKRRPVYSFICLMKIWYFFTETCLHLIMLKGDMEIHFLDRTVDHPITVRKLIPSN